MHLHGFFVIDSGFTLYICLTNNIGSYVHFQLVKSTLSLIAIPLSLIGWRQVYMHSLRE
ncbi:hypothetical protein BCAH1134_C0664 (plasmid) [Bacillus cereus AH1134]|nr:hypothetical protein BCAH1134_C0664 [Bacillus cereus AH1134]